MATQIVQAPPSAVSTTEPLPPAAAAAAAKLTARFPRLDAAESYESAAVRAVQLAAVAETGHMSDLDADSLAHAEDLMAGLLPEIGGAR
ncbi:hypothetical protein [Streptomyces sp. NPDC101249]|uniref:hypothetical protein n=1 Tax=Streptomyces sp. NPDC101249 TaxID=3366140 RepID=UPI0037F12341